MTLATALTTLGVLGTGVMAGVYVAFSVMVMPALDSRPPHEAVGFVQVTNRCAVRPGFQVWFSGTALVAVALVAVAFAAEGVERGWLLVGSFAYLFTIVLTGVVHVPRNNAVDAVDSSDPEASRAAWAAYSRPWTLGNHVRALLSIVALVAYAVALRAA